MRRTRLFRFLLLLVGLNIPALLAQENSARHPDVSFIPTPRKVVREMLKLANVQPSDVVYDLGCGDGRVVITAAKEFGAGGVGIDIDSDRIRQSGRNARKAGVAHRVSFRTEDLFQADISEATVVALYLLQTLNYRLRPKLLRELEPGTRIVSYTFDIPDWPPEKQIEMDEGTIYLWTVPAHDEQP